MMAKAATAVRVVLKSWGLLESSTLFSASQGPFVPLNTITGPF